MYMYGNVPKIDIWRRVGARTFPIVNKCSKATCMYS